MKKLAIICALAGAATLATPASAQDTSARPNAGTLNLSAGFTPDPRTVNIVAGGDINATRLGGSCSGQISSAPDVRVTYAAGSGLPLVFSVTSEADTTLVINAPDGRWYCNDDTNGLNPQLVFRNAGRGNYEVWIGKLSGDNAAGRLSVSEIAPN